jgi:hypothetical protein
LKEEGRAIGLAPFYFLDIVINAKQSFAPMAFPSRAWERGKNTEGLTFIWAWRPGPWSVSWLAGHKGRSGALGTAG